MDTVRGTLEGPATEFVTITGLVPQAEAPAYLSIADAFLSPHVRNPDGTPFFGSPTKLFEYMGMGRTIIASDLEQIGAILRPALHASALPDPVSTPGRGDHVAILTSPGNDEELERAIRFVADASDWRLAIGRRVRAHALARFTWDHHVAAILDGIGRLEEDS
jgi:glycosyltransferase involved in cell wall biosynthesis